MTKFLSKDGKFYMRDGKLLGYTPPMPQARLTPQAGITYTSDLSGIRPAMLTMFSQAISNNADITYATNTVYVDYKQTHVKIDVGNQVMIALDGTDYAFDVIGFNHDYLTDANAYGSETSTGKAGITFQMHDLLITTYPINSSNTNVGGWKDSLMRTSTMMTPLKVGYMPAAWQRAIKHVYKASGIGSGSSSIESTSDDCFLLAEVEIFGSAINTASGEGTQYAYYKAGNSKVKKKGGFTNIWWTRSPAVGDSETFCLVDSSGNININDADTQRGVAFAFCI